MLSRFMMPEWNVYEWKEQRLPMARVPLQIWGRLFYLSDRCQDAWIRILHRDFGAQLTCQRVDDARAEPRLHPGTVDRETDTGVPDG